MLCNSAERPTRGPARHLIGTVEPDLDHAHHSGPNGKKASCFLSLRSRENLRVMARQRWQNRAPVNSIGAGKWSAETAELSAVHVFELHPLILYSRTADVLHRWEQGGRCARGGT